MTSTWQDPTGREFGEEGARPTDERVHLQRRLVEPSLWGAFVAVSPLVAWTSATTTRCASRC